MLKAAAGMNEIHLSPEEVMIDFEKAAKKAFESVFDVKVIGCLFHFGQSLFKKLCAVGLKQSYLEKKDIQVWFKSVFCLDYYKQILDIFKFEPKQKYVEELEDTDEDTDEYFRK